MSPERTINTLLLIMCKWLKETFNFERVHLHPGQNSECISNSYKCIYLNFPIQLQWFSRCLAWVYQGVIMISPFSLRRFLLTLSHSYSNLFVSECWKTLWKLNSKLVRLIEEGTIFYEGEYPEYSKKTLASDWHWLKLSPHSMTVQVEGVIDDPMADLLLL